MRFDKFTIKSQELIQNAQTLAAQHHNQQIEPEHLLAAMLAETGGIAGAMLRKLGASPNEIVQEVNAAVGRIPGREETRRNGTTSYRWRGDAGAARGCGP